MRWPLKFWWSFLLNSLFEVPVPLCPVQEILITFFGLAHFLKYPFPLSGAGDFDDLFLLNSLFEVPFVQGRRFWWSFFLKLTFWSTGTPCPWPAIFTTFFFFFSIHFLNFVCDQRFSRSFSFFLNSLIELCPWPEILTIWAPAAFSVKSRLLSRWKKFNDIFSSFLFSLKLTFYRAQKRADRTGGGKMCLRVCASCV